MNVWPEQVEILRNEFESGFALLADRIVRKISQFAVEEIVLPPTGPFREQQFDIDRQPFVRLWFELVESGQFPRYAVTGPVQSGKTLCCLVIPALWHLFEIGENVACGIPQMEMAHDKWEQDFLPIIKASRYADLLPVSGQGSRGGKFESITFRNGATLKFLSAQGGDEKRSGFTARVLLMTEIDKYDEAKESSREGDPVTQMIARSNAFEVMNTIVYMECSPSIEAGRIWVEYTDGSAGKIVTQCPHIECREYVSLEREHLQGWQDATNEIDARERAHFACPKCGQPWTEEQRIEANRTAKLLHRGQTITPDGVIHGPLPKTLTAGFRWSAANNLFKPAADIGGKEWKAKYAPDEENSDKAITQFDFAMPAKATVSDQTPLDVKTLLDRCHAYGRGVVPPGCDTMAVGLDLGGWWCTWTAMAWGQNAHGYVIDYGRIAVPQATLGLEVGLMEAMREFRELCTRGWVRAGDGQVIVPDENLIDSGWQTPLAYEFIRETGLPFRPCKGLSVAGESVSYNRPKSTGAIVQWIGDGWHIARLKDDNIDLLEIDADGAKSLLHARLSCDVSAPGAITFFQIDRNDLPEVELRRRYVRQLTAEKMTSEFVKGRGVVTRWTKIRHDNHGLDATALALVGGSLNGVSVVDDAEEVPPAAAPASTPAPAPAPSLAAIAQTVKALMAPPPKPMPAAVSQEIPKPTVRTVSSSWLRRS